MLIAMNDLIHEDARGAIRWLCKKPVSSIVSIFSKRESVRGNHYHKTGGHLCYIVQGEANYYYKQVGNGVDPVVAGCRVSNLKSGMMVETPENMLHAFKFLEDTLMHVYAFAPRDQKSYEEDTVRVPFIS